MNRDGETERTEVTSLGALYRNPGEKPLATIVASLILGAIGYQAVVAAREFALWAGFLVLVVGYAAYRIARVAWQVQNSYVGAELRVARLEDETSTASSSRVLNEQPAESPVEE